VVYRFLLLGIEEEDAESVRFTEWMRREAAFGRGECGVVVSEVEAMALLRRM
jgi:hypothetical protein